MTKMQINNDTNEKTKYSKMHTQCPKYTKNAKTVLILMMSLVDDVVYWYLIQ
jgi:hypothetical protein